MKDEAQFENLVSQNPLNEVRKKMAQQAVKKVSVKKKVGEATEQPLNQM